MKNTAPRMKKLTLKRPGRPTPDQKQKLAAERARKLLATRQTADKP